MFEFQHLLYYFWAATATATATVTAAAAAAAAAATTAAATATAEAIYELKSLRAKELTLLRVYELTSLGCGGKLREKRGVSDPSASNSQILAAFKQ